MKDDYVTKTEFQKAHKEADGKFEFLARAIAKNSESIDRIDKRLDKLDYQVTKNAVMLETIQDTVQAIAEMTGAEMVKSTDFNQRITSNTEKLASHDIAITALQKSAN